MEPGFQGRLLRIEVPDLLTFVNMGRRTGLLEMERDAQTTRVFFRDGNPVFASCNKEGLRLGDLLLRTNKVTRKDMDRCVARHRAGGHRLGQVLVSEGAITEEELSQYLKVLVSEVIFDTFNWGTGSFRFYDDMAPPPDAVTLEMDIQNLLMEGVRRLDERGRLAEVFADMDAVLETLANPDRVKGNVTLTPDEWQVFFLVDGRRSVREICQVAGNPDDLATLEMLNRLLSGNLIGFATVHAPAAVAAPPPAAAASDPAPAAARALETTAPVPVSDPGPAATEEPAFAQSTVKYKVMQPSANRSPAPSEAPDGVSPVSPPVPAAAPPPSAPAAGPPAAPSTPPLVVARPGRPTGDASVVVSRDAVQYTSRTVAISARLLLDHDGRQAAFPLLGETHTVGRGPKNDIVIRDPKVSNFHARVDRTPQGWTIVDLKSTNGTYLRGQRITSLVLEPGVELVLGGARLRYVED